jgi:hypothetical protein
MNEKSLLLYQFTKKTDCINYCWSSLLSTSYKMLSNILLSRLSPYIAVISADHQCGLRRSRSIIDQIFCIHIGEKNGSRIKQYVNYS